LLEIWRWKQIAKIEMKGKFLPRKFEDVDIILFSTPQKLCLCPTFFIRHGKIVVFY
jgi:hypothetical protein